MIGCSLVFHINKSIAGLDVFSFMLIIIFDETRLWQLSICQQNNSIDSFKYCIITNLSTKSFTNQNMDGNWLEEMLFRLLKILSPTFQPFFKNRILLFPRFPEFPSTTFTLTQTTTSNNNNNLAYMHARANKMRQVFFPYFHLAKQLTKPFSSMITKLSDLWFYIYIFKSNHFQRWT